MDANPTSSESPGPTFESIIRPKMDGRPELRGRPAAQRRLRVMTEARRAREPSPVRNFRNLWGCFPVYDLETFFWWVVVWGGTALIVVLLYVVTFPPNYCSPGHAPNESCPGMWWADAVRSQSQIHTTVPTTTHKDTSNQHWTKNGNIHMTKSVTVDSVVPLAGHTVPTQVSVTPVIDSPHDILKKRERLAPVDPLHSQDKVFQNEPDSKDPPASVEPPASVFITFTPTEFLTEATPATAAPPTSHTVTPVVTHSAPPPASHSEHPPATHSPSPLVESTTTTRAVVSPTPPAETPTTTPAALNTPTVPDDEGYDSTTTVVERTTLHVPGNGSAPAETHTQKASGGRIIRVQYA
ncbi:hypothetical protein V8F20_006387 [Naviculisporaceae sp. PSN 640]